jgi:hypothetical protein
MNQFLYQYIFSERREGGREGGKERRSSFKVMV